MSGALLDRDPEPQDVRQPPTGRTSRGSGLVVAIANHRWAIPLGTILAGVAGACGIAYQVVQGHVAAYEDRLTKLESSVAQIRSDGGADHALLLDIRSQLAEIRAVLMRRSP